MEVKDEDNITFSELQLNLADADLKVQVEKYARKISKNWTQKYKSKKVSLRGRRTKGREGRSLNASAKRDRASRSHSTSPSLPSCPLCTPATQAIKRYVNWTKCLPNVPINRRSISRRLPTQRFKIPAEEDLKMFHYCTDTICVCKARFLEKIRRFLSKINLNYK